MIKCEDIWSTNKKLLLLLKKDNCCSSTCSVPSLSPKLNFHAEMLNNELHRFAFRVHAIKINIHNKTVSLNSLIYSESMLALDDDKHSAILWDCAAVLRGILSLAKAVSKCQQLPAEPQSCGTGEHVELSRASWQLLALSTEARSLAGLGGFSVRVLNN